MVLCHTSKAVESGKLCDAIYRDCSEARLSCRKIDVSNTDCVFEFGSEFHADAMLNASIDSMPGATFKKIRPFYWLVESMNAHHVGHSQPYRDCEKNLYLTYAMKTLTTAASQTAEDGKQLLAKVCSVMQNLLTPKMGKIVTNQVAVAVACLQNVESTWKICSRRD